MGRTLHLRKVVKTDWDEISSDVIKSWIDPTAILPANPVNPRTNKPYKYQSPKMGRLNLEHINQLGNVFFRTFGGQFGCREGLTRTMQDANDRYLHNKNSIVIIKDRLALPVETNIYEFSEHWKKFIKEMLTCSKMSPELADYFALVSTDGKTICFPVTREQKDISDSTFASAMILLLRNISALLRKDGSFRSYKEFIKHTLESLESVWEENEEIKLRNAKVKIKNSKVLHNNTDTVSNMPPMSPYENLARFPYPGLNTNIMLWFILDYASLLRKSQQDNPSSRPNGPHSFITRHPAGIHQAIKTSDNEQAKIILDFLGGPDSSITRKYTSTIRNALLDRAGKLK